MGLQVHFNASVCEGEESVTMALRVIGEDRVRDGGSGRGGKGDGGE